MDKLLELEKKMDKFFEKKKWIKKKNLGGGVQTRQELDDLLTITVTIITHYT